MKSQLLSVLVNKLQVVSFVWCIGPTLFGKYILFF